jgi:hypothetical protein
METVHFCETTINFHETTKCNIPEDISCPTNREETLSAEVKSRGVKLDFAIFNVEVKKAHSCTSTPSIHPNYVALKHGDNFKLHARNRSRILQPIQWIRELYCFSIDWGTPFG